MSDAFFNQVIQEFLINDVHIHIDVMTAAVIVNIRHTIVFVDIKLVGPFMLVMHLIHMFINDRHVRS